MNILRHPRSLPALVLSLAIVGVGLPGASAAADAQEPVSPPRRAPRTSGSAIGDVFFGPDHVARTRSHIHGQSLVDAAVRRSRRDAAERGDERRFDRPGSGLGRPARKPRVRRRARSPLAHRFFGGGRMIIVYPPDARVAEPQPRPEPRRAGRSPDVSPSRHAPGADSSGATGPGAPSAVAGRIGRHLRSVSGEAESAGSATCASVEVETGSGIGFELRVDPGALGVERPDEVSRILRGRLERDEHITLPRVEGEALTLPARGIDAILVGRCR